VKAAVICRAIAQEPSAAIRHILLHTGQHYDAQMSDVFFRELGMPAADHNLEVGSGTHGYQTAETIRRLEPLLLQEQPDWVLLYGDTNATLAGAIATAKNPAIRIAHIEAGLRSFNRNMPEEINRVVADHLSHLLLCPTVAAIENLRREGLAGRAVMTGDVMYDCVLAMREIAERQNSALAESWRPREFALATIHRQENTDDPARLQAILAALEEIARSICPVLLPLHPRTRKKLDAEGWRPNQLTLTGPVSYLEMLMLEGRARMILTDSGGVQKEAYFARVPCITLRDETEWVETLQDRCNVLAGAEYQRIVQAAREAHSAGPWNALYGDGNAGRLVVRSLLQATMAPRA
jgi:UDP-GlcNAc3NAcA epimerase